MKKPDFTPFFGLNLKIPEGGPKSTKNQYFRKKVVLLGPPVLQKKYITCIEFGNKNMKFVKIFSGGVLLTVGAFIRQGQVTGMGIVLKCYKNKLRKLNL